MSKVIPIHRPEAKAIDPIAGLGVRIVAFALATALVDLIDKYPELASGNIRTALAEMLEERS